MFHNIPAGVGERMQYIAHKYNDTTIRFVLKYPIRLNPETLLAATAAVIREVDVLHASFVPKSRTSHWHIHSNFQPSDYFSLMECDGDPIKPAESVSLSPINYKGKCQMHVTLILGEVCSAVVVRISHLVVDGSDGKYLLNKLAESYRMFEESGDPNELEIKNGSRSAQQAYSDLSIRELSSLCRMPFHGTKTQFPFSAPKDSGPLRLLRCSVPAETLSVARKKAKEVGATANDLLLTAAYRSFAKTAHRQGPMSISAMMDLRQHCKNGISEGLANLSGGLSTELDYAQDRNFREDLELITAQTAAAKADPMAGLDGIPLLHTATKTLPMWLLLQAANIVYSSMSLSMTNLGNIPCAPLAMEGVVPTKGFFGGPLKRKPSVQVAAASFEGTLELTILGDYLTEDLPSLSTFLEGIREEIEQYILEE